MNRVTNQVGESIIARGSDYSYIRINDQYCVTIPKIMTYLKSKSNKDELLNENTYDQCKQICVDDIIEKSMIPYVITTAIHYFSKGLVVTTSVNPKILKVGDRIKYGDLIITIDENKPMHSTSAIGGLKGSAVNRDGKPFYIEYSCETRFNKII